MTEPGRSSMPSAASGFWRCTTCRGPKESFRITLRARHKGRSSLLQPSRLSRARRSESASLPATSNRHGPRRRDDPASARTRGASRGRGRVAGGAPRPAQVLARGAFGDWIRKWPYFFSHTWHVSSVVDSHPPPTPVSPLRLRNQAPPTALPPKYDLPLRDPVGPVDVAGDSPQCAAPSGPIAVGQNAPPSSTCARPQT